MLFVAAALSACVPMTPPPVARMQFPEAEYLALAKAGNSTVKGQAFLKTRGGDVKTAAGNEVNLNPVTTYSIEWYEKSYLLAHRIVPADPRMRTYVTKQVADGSGRFTFKNVAPGEYFVTSTVTWEAPTGYQGALIVQGGVVSKRITVKDGDDIEVIVTR